METNEPLESFIRMLRATKRLESRRLERAFRAAPRHWFVDRMHAHSKRPRFIDVNRSRPTRRHLERIYSDEALVTHRDPPSSTSQPSLVAFMLEALDVRAGARVLEIGAGTGWNAALMAHLVGPSGSVVSVDIQADVARCARRHIKRAGVANVTVATGDGAMGHARAAPYDRLITTVSCPDVFPAWHEQLKPRGIAVITLGDLPGDGTCLLLKLRRKKTHLAGEVVLLPGFMVLTGKHSVPLPWAETRKRLDEHTTRGSSRRHRALWAAIPDGRSDQMRRDLAFFAHLEGLRVETLERQFVLSSRETRDICVLEETHVSAIGGSECYGLYKRVEEKWLHLGAPTRMQYRVEVWPVGVRKRAPVNGWLTHRTHSQLLFRLK